MSIAHVVGVDPGIVHSGVVSLQFHDQTRTVIVREFVVHGPDAAAVRHQVEYMIGAVSNVAKPAVFIEGYRPRSNLAHDTRMVSAVSEMHKALRGSTVLNNTGIKTVVKKPLMELLEVWKFKTPTNHDDLRSAARIALLGMFKDDDLNGVVAGVVADHLKGRSWHVQHG